MIKIDLKTLFYDSDYYSITTNNEITFYPNNKNVGITKEKDFYTIIKLNKSKNTITFYQDYLGDKIQYYYAFIENTLIIDNSIKSIVKIMKIKKFDKKSLYYFLSCGFIPNKKTLIKGLYKVVPGFINKINIKTKKLKLKKITFENIYNKFDDKEYKNMLIKNMEDNIDTKKTISFAISSGFDSNLLITLFNKYVKKNNNFYSIGGSKGVNEIPYVRKIVKEYDCKNLITEFVTPNTFKNYHKIVYMYEGLFYERGIFLQYELFKLLENESTNLILGEGADQILHINNMTSKNIAKLIKKKNYNLYKNCPNEMLKYIVLKKSSILLNNTKNNIIYPYLYANFREYNYKFGDLYGYDKKKHKEIVKSEVNSNVFCFLSKIGGATNQESLFANQDSFERLKNKVLKSKYSKIKCLHNTNELSLDVDYVLKLVYLTLFEEIFISSNKYIENHELLNNMDTNNLLEI